MKIMGDGGGGEGGLDESETPGNTFICYIFKQKMLISFCTNIISKHMNVGNDYERLF